MRIIKTILVLFAAVISIAAMGQNRENLTRKDWEARAKSVKSVKEIVNIHKNNKKTLTDKMDLLTNDIFVVITAGEYLCRNVDKKIEPAEKQLYTIVKSIDISSEDFASFFVENTYPLKSFFYVKYLAQGEPRDLAMGNMSQENYYQAIEYDYKRVAEVLEKCHPSIRENHCSTLITPRSDANEHMKALKPIIERQLTDSQYKRDLLNRLETLKGLFKGEPAPDWSYQDRNGDFYSLSDFKGKFLVIDMWATWCGGCVANINKFITLGEKFADRGDVQFITMSVDKKGSYYDWKYALSKYGLMHALNLITFDDPTFEEKYHFTGVPRYFIIDPKGNIVTTSAPSPSVALEKLIEKTLAEYDSTNEVNKMLVEDYPAEILLPIGSKYYNKYVNEINKFSTKEKRDKGREIIKSVLDQSSTEILFSDDAKKHNPANVIKVTNQILDTYKLLNLQSDVQYHYIKAMNLMYNRHIAESFDYLKKNIFENNLFDMSYIENVVFFGKSALYPYTSLGIDDARISKAKISEIVDVVTEPNAKEYLKGYVSKYDNMIKYIIESEEIEKEKFNKL